MSLSFLALSLCLCYFLSLSLFLSFSFSLSLSLPPPPPPPTPLPPSGGSLVRREVAHNLMRLIAEGTEDDDTDAELRLDAVSAYLELLDKSNLPDILVKIICWVRCESMCVCVCVCVNR